MGETRKVIEVALLTLTKCPSRTEYVYRFTKLADAIAFIDLNLENGYEVDIRQIEK